MKSDTQLRAGVTDELAWDVAINANNIGVMATTCGSPAEGQLPRR
jgi:hypothetical protein